MAESLSSIKRRLNAMEAKTGIATPDQTNCVEITLWHIVGKRLVQDPTLQPEHAALPNNAVRSPFMMNLTVIPSGKFLPTPAPAASMFTQRFVTRDPDWLEKLRNGETTDAAPIDSAPTPADDAPQPCGNEIEAEPVELVAPIAVETAPPIPWPAGVRRAPRLVDAPTPPENVLNYSPLIDSPALAPDETAQEADASALRAIATERKLHLVSSNRAPLPERADNDPVAKGHSTTATEALPPANVATPLSSPVASSAPTAPIPASFVPSSFVASVIRRD